jgi:hypothetical protein
MEREVEQREEELRRYRDRLGRVTGELAAIALAELIGEVMARLRALEREERSSRDVNR